MRSVHVALLLLASLGGACGSDAGPCAEPRDRLILPSPTWDLGDRLTPPADDRAAALVRQHRGSWLPALERLDGWPMRPTLVLPLSASASAVDASRVSLFDRSAGGEWHRAEVPFSATLSEAGDSLVLVPRSPMPPAAVEVIVAIAPGATSGATVLGACGADGTPHAAYAEAAAALPDDVAVELAVPMRLATTQELLPRLARSLPATQPVTVTAVAARPLTDCGTAAVTLAATGAAYSELVQGRAALPDYRGEGGRFAVGADGLPPSTTTTEPGFLVLLPATGAPPFPFVLFQHGGGQDKWEALHAAAPLLAAGFAVVAIDLPHHGDRGSGGGPFAMLSWDDPEATRDNFRQAAADLMTFASSTAVLNAAVASTLGVADALDGEAVHMMGLSMGAIAGSLATASSPAVRGAALYVAGAGYPAIVQYGLFSLYFYDLSTLPADEHEVLLGLLEALLNGADPFAYAQRVEERGAPPRPLLFFQGQDDPVMSASANDQWAAAFGADLAVPYLHEVSGMDALPLPAADNFSWGGPAATRVLVQCPMAETPVTERHGELIRASYTQEIVSHCFATLRDTGSCEVINSGFALH